MAEERPSLSKEHVGKVKMAKSAIASIYGDVSVSNAQIKQSLRILRVDIDGALASIDKLEALAQESS